MNIFRSTTPPQDKFSIRKQKLLDDDKTRNLSYSTQKHMNLAILFSPLKDWEVFYKTRSYKMLDSLDHSVTNLLKTPFILHYLDILKGACLPMPRGDELNNFFEKAGASIIFGLNAVYGNYTRSFCCRAFGFQICCRSYSLPCKTAASMVGNLVNELSGTGIGAKVTTAQYASDVISLNFYRARYLQLFQS